MQSIVFCSRCRGMKVGWNGPYLMHRLMCREWVSKSSKLLVLTVFLAVLFFTYPAPSAFVFSGDHPYQPLQQVALQRPAMVKTDPAVRSIEAFLARYGVDESHRSRVAESIIVTGRKYNLDPRLLASVMIVESRANPFAISGSDAIGIMQIHLPTWGRTADKEGINLFKIEDNIDFGARILRNYIRQFGVWDGVKRYNGWLAEDPESERSADEYVVKIQRIYGFEEPTSTANLLQ